MFANIPMNALLLIVMLSCSAVFAGSIARQQTESPRLAERRGPSPAGRRSDSGVVVDPASGLVEVSENEIPEDTVVYVMDELEVPREDGESLQTADNIVFRPLFSYRNRQEALSRRRVGNGYRRRYFVQRRPYRYAYYPGYQYY